MRIVAGSWRGRKLLGPVGKNTRPILDRVKESVFDVLGSHYATPGRLPSLAVLDLFCGTGSMGLEALSRGAGWCTFVDRDHSAIRRLKSNICNLNASDRTAVLVGDALTLDLRSGRTGPYQLVFIDPPFVKSRRTGSAGLTARLLDKLGDGRVVSPDALILCRHEAKIRLDLELGPYRQGDCRVYGRMAVSFYQQGRDLDAAPPPP